MPLARPHVYSGVTMSDFEPAYLTALEPGELERRAE
jgi:hypothetical protein